MPAFDRKTLSLLYPGGPFRAFMKQIKKDREDDLRRAFWHMGRRPLAGTLFVPFRKQKEVVGPPKDLSVTVTYKDFITVFDEVVHLEGE